jgi:DNA-binding NtrC family response regulator
MNDLPQPTIPLPPRIALWIGDERIAQQVREALSGNFGTVADVPDMQQLNQWLDERHLEIVIADSLGAGGYASQIAARCQTDGCRSVLVAVDSPLAHWPRDESATPPFATIPVGLPSSGVRAIVEAAGKQAKLVADLHRSRKRLSQAMTHELVGYSPVITGLRQIISAAAADPSPLFLCGESGTGKKLISRMVHALSDRAHAPRISLNCRILPSTQLDRELFLGGEATRDGFRRGHF